MKAYKNPLSNLVRVLYTFPDTLPPGTNLHLPTLLYFSCNKVHKQSDGQSCFY